MKNMKLIMENFRRNMTEARASRADTKKAENEVIQLVKDKYGEDLSGLEMEPKPINSLVAYMKDKYNQKTGLEADEQQVLAFLDALNIFDDEQGTEQGLELALGDEDDQEFDPTDV